MNKADVVYVVGSGAVGMALVACLTKAGRRAVSVRTSRADAPPKTEKLVLVQPTDRLEVSVETIGLSMLQSMNGMVAVTAKSYANAYIARELAKKLISGPIVILQNGVSVEYPFVEAGFREIYRCVLYLTSQRVSAREISFHSIRSSSIGTIIGNGAGLDYVVDALSTSRFPFHAEQRIQREVWKKAIINAVFNSICPLLETDNGVFMRSSPVAELANEIVNECLVLTNKLGLEFSPSELIEQILEISKSSDGQLISTLQDIRNGRETEIEYLNLEMARVATAQQPPINLPKTELLGRMTEMKAKLQMKGEKGET
jgi:2-dehydropantoate 2-reductase